MELVIICHKTVKKVTFMKEAFIFFLMFKIYIFCFSRVWSFIIMYNDFPPNLYLVT